MFFFSDYTTIIYLFLNFFFMKRRMFTLLLAIVALTAFQANAQQQRSWILADTSGLAANALYNDSFPNAKLGLYNWLSEKEDGTVYVHPRVDATDSYEIYRDKSNKFQVDTVKGNPHRFLIKSETTSGESFKLNWAGALQSHFEIVQFTNEIREVQKFAGDSIEGYLALPQGDNLASDSAELVLAGSDTKGTISFKKFSDFGAKVEGPPPAAFTVYQVGDEKVLGRVYQCQEPPFLQTYYYGSSDSTLVLGTHGRKNWEDDSSKDSLYTYLNMVLKDGKIGISADSLVRLDTIFNFLKTQPTLENVVDTFAVDSKEDSVLYFVSQGDKLYFTAPKEGATNLSKKESWTLDKPSPFPYEGKGNFWYGIKIDGDTTTVEAFQRVLVKYFGYEKSDFLPQWNESEKYIYTKGDDWKPLYIKVVPSCDPQPYEYVDSKWLKDGNYDLGAAIQSTVTAKGIPNGAVSNDEKTGNAIIIEEGHPKSSKFFFELVDSILGTTQTLSKGPSGVTFKNEKTIELFSIKDGDKYLTVLDTTIFVDPKLTDSVFTNTQLGWETKFEDNTVDRYRQAFAIVYNKDRDSIITLLPVASYKWIPSEGVSSYGKDLYYNTTIGAEKEDDCGVKFVDLSDVWYITQMSETGANKSQRLVLVDKTLTPIETHNTAIWFKTEMKLDMWNGPGCGDTIFAVYNADSTKYYSAGSKDNKANGKLDDVTAADIRSHWYATPNKPKTGELKEWTFTPNVETIYNTAQQRVLKNPRIALKLGDGKIELVYRTAPYQRDTIQVVCLDVPDAPFMNLDPYASASKKVAIVESLYKDRNISYYGLHEDSVERRNPTTLEAFLRGIDSSKTETLVDVRKSNVQKLGKYKPIEVPYYVFSYTDDYDKKEYFLKANLNNNDSVQWVSFTDTDKDKALQKELLEGKTESVALAPFKFCLPFVNIEDPEDGRVYLQTFDVGQQEKFALVKAGNETGIVNAINFYDALKSTTDITKNEGIYAAVGQYKNNMKQISSWIIYSEDGVASEWVRVDDAVDDIEEATSVGVLTNVDYLGPGAAYLAPSSETKDSTATDAANYGVLTNAKERGADFTLEYKGVAQIGFNKDSIWYYNIYTIVEGDSLYLTDAADSISTTTPNKKYQYVYPTENNGTAFTYGYFTPTKLPEQTDKTNVYADKNFRQTFGLKYTESVDERVGFYFVIVSSADYNSTQNNYRYLGRAGNRLVFVSGEESALRFQWGKVTDDGYVGIKEVGAPAKIYGVSGGVKVANVSGAVSIYTIDGRLVTGKVAVSANQTIAVPAGIYIVKSGTDVAKVVVR
jgi:hypothetical protein